MKGLYEKYKREILVGVVVSLITTVVIKFGDWLVAIIPVVSISTFETITNVLYYLAATYSDSFLYSILLLGGLSVFAGSTLKLIIESLRIYRHTLRLEKKSKKLSVEELEKIHQQTLNELDNDYKQEKQDTYVETINRGKRLGKLGILMIVLILLLYTLVTFFITSPMTLADEFEKDIIMIAPYIEEEQIIQLKSDWVCMRSKSDYNDIYQLIKEVKDTYSLPD